MANSAEGFPATQSGSLVDGVFDALLEEIISGAAPVGSRLAAERVLTERFGVNRQVVREALQRLEQIGLVSPGQGSGTTVLDWYHSGTFELLGYLLKRSAEREEPNLDLARSMLELRLEYSVSVARLCCLHAPPETFDAIEAIIRHMTPRTDPVERTRRGWEIWSLMVDGTGNIAYRLMFNSGWTDASTTVAVMKQYSAIGPADNIALFNMLSALRNRDVEAVEMAVRWMFRIESSLPEGETGPGGLPARSVIPSGNGDATSSVESA